MVEENGSQILIRMESDEQTDQVHLAWSQFRNKPVDITLVIGRNVTAFKPSFSVLRTQAVAQLTIKGEDGLAQIRTPFAVAARRVTFENVHIADGQGNGQVAAVEAITFKNTIVSDNRVRKKAIDGPILHIGGFDNSGPEVTFDSSAFVNNRSQGPLIGTAPRTGQTLKRLSFSNVIFADNDVYCLIEPMLVHQLDFNESIVVQAEGKASHIIGQTSALSMNVKNSTWYTPTLAYVLPLGTAEEHSIVLDQSEIRITQTTEMPPFWLPFTTDITTLTPTEASQQRTVVTQGLTEQRLSQVPLDVAALRQILPRHP